VDDTTPRPQRVDAPGLTPGRYSETRPTRVVLAQPGRWFTPVAINETALRLLMEI